ncbi:MAG: methyltransferase [Gammaproteobacteria bacterium]|nr:methyltransferase [Gammaproteobacteria bacterium]
MKFEQFYNSIISVISRKFENNISQDAIQNFANNLSIIFNDNKSESSLKMTRMTILFEGFYQFLPSESELKKDLLTIKMQRWVLHFGTPTIAFLLSYMSQIEQTKDHFIKVHDSIGLGIELSSPMPWHVTATLKSAIDKSNDVVIDEHKMNAVLMPELKEETGKFLKTHNSSGGFTTTPCDSYSQQFIKHAKSLKKKGGSVLEIGAAFGAASLQVTSSVVKVFCNDIEAKNLAVIRNRYLQGIKKSASSVTGDEENLILLPGSFPEELAGLPNDSFDAILICRVLHFFPGKKIDQALSLIEPLLKPSGRVYIICETPYLKNWKTFIPEYEKRVSAEIEWPGEITDASSFESSGRVALLPKFVHWISKDVIEMALKRNSFDIVNSSYIDRKGQFPDDLLLDGKESVGVEARRAKHRF